MKKLIRLGLLLLLAFLFFRLSGLVFSPSRGEEAALLTNRVWVAHMPKDERDLVPHLMLFEKSGYRGGAFGVASAWRVETSLVRFRYDPPKLELEIPQRGIKGRVDVRIHECKDAPKPFDLCLELKEGERKLRLYSRLKWRLKDWVPVGFDDSPFENRLAAWVRMQIEAPRPSDTDPPALVDAPEKLLFPGR